MDEITIEKQVWTEDLGDRHSETAKKILLEELHRVDRASIGKKVVCTHIKIEYETYQDVLNLTYLPVVQYNGRANITATFQIH